jgi:hypothetical protein
MLLVRSLGLILCGFFHFFSFLLAGAVGLSFFRYYLVFFLGICSFLKESWWFSLVLLLLFIFLFAFWGQLFRRSGDSLCYYYDLMWGPLWVPSRALFGVFMCVVAIVVVSGLVEWVVTSLLLFHWCFFKDYYRLFFFRGSAFSGEVSGFTVGEIISFLFVLGWPLFSRFLL